jgi:hypothetical protein
MSSVKKLLFFVFPGGVDVALFRAITAQRGQLRAETASAFANQVRTVRSCIGRYVCSVIKAAACACVRPYLSRIARNSFWFFSRSEL